MYEFIYTPNLCLINAFHIIFCVINPVQLLMNQ